MNTNTSNSKPRLSRCLSNTSSKRNHLLKSIQNESDNNFDMTSSPDTTNPNTRKIPVNLSSEDNVKHLIHKREDLLTNIHNIEKEIETAIKHNSVHPHINGGNESELVNQSSEPVTDDTKMKLIEWFENVNFVKDNSLTPDMLNQVLQNG